MKEGSELEENGIKVIPGYSSLYNCYYYHIQKDSNNLNMSRMMYVVSTIYYKGKFIYTYLI